MEVRKIEEIEDLVRSCRELVVSEMINLKVDLVCKAKIYLKKHEIKVKLVNFKLISGEIEVNKINDYR